MRSFLSAPLVPVEFSNNGLFIELKRLGLIRDIDYHTIIYIIQASILYSNELCELLRWLCSDECIYNYNNKYYIENIFSYIRFRDNDSSPIITLRHIKYYDEINPSSQLPLPSNVLPAVIAMQISPDDLSKHLGLAVFSLDNLIDFYFLDEQNHLLKDENKIICLFNFISIHWIKIKPSQRDQIKVILSKRACIPTQQGMKLPKESFIRSPMLLPDLPIIKMNVVKEINQIKITSDQHEVKSNGQSYDGVLDEFLRFIGCRTIHVPSFIAYQKSLSKVSDSIKENFLMFLHHLVDTQKIMSDEDIIALQESRCFPGNIICMHQILASNKLQ